MRIVKIFMWVNLFLSGFFFYNMFNYGYSWEDAMKRTLLYPFEGTVWAKGFTESGFESIQLSMTENQVLAILGEPLFQNCGEGICFWMYTGQDTQTADFDQRWVVIGKDGKVSEIRKSFFID